MEACNYSSITLMALYYAGRLIAGGVQFMGGKGLGIPEGDF